MSKERGFRRLTIVLSVITAVIGGVIGSVIGFATLNRFLIDKSWSLQHRELWSTFDRIVYPLLIRGWAIFIAEFITVLGILFGFVAVWVVFFLIKYIAMPAVCYIVKGFKHEGH